MRNLENVYAPVNRATNEEFRKGWDRIEWDVKYPEEVAEEGIERQLRREGRKGKVFGHFC